LKKSGFRAVFRRTGLAKVAEVFLGDQPLFDQLVRLFGHLAHVHHGEVADVGREDGAQAMVAVPVEGPCGDGVVSLAAEVEALGEVGAQLVPGLHRDRREVVELVPVGALGEIVDRLEGLGQVDAAEDLVGLLLVDPPAVLPEELLEEAQIQVGRLRLGFHRIAAAPLPVTDEVGHEVARPPDTALQEGKAQLREPVGDAAEDESLGEGVAGIGDVTDVVRVKVHRIVCATDPGYAVNPAQIERQIAGSFVYGLSALFMEECTVKDGHIEQTNFHDYDSMRIAQMRRVLQAAALPAGLGRAVSRPARVGAALKGRQCHLGGRLDPHAGDGLRRHQATVANVIPPQRAGRIAEVAGVADRSGWCPIDPVTFESKLQTGIHVIGDAAIAGAMPKSAFAANSQAKTCAAAVARLLTGAVPSVPKLINTCYSLVAPDYGISIAGVLPRRQLGSAARR
jgi:hypothetical protein